MSGPRLIVVWRVTERCNMGCHFCAYDRRLARSRDQADDGEVLRFGQLLASYAESRRRRVMVSWLGGEPFLWPALRSASDALRGLRIGLSLTTNGLALAQPSWHAWALEALDELTVSVDGGGAFHDRVRDQPGARAVVLDAIRRLAADKRRAGRGPLLRVNTILMRGNVSDFGALCAELADAGIDELTFNQLGGNDRPEFYPENRLLPEQVEAFCEALPAHRAAFAARSMVIRGSPAYVDRIRATARGVALPIDDCGPGQSFWFIDEAGLVAPCSFTPSGYGIPLSTLRTTADLDDLPARWTALRRRGKLGPCLDCHSTQVFDKFRESRAEER